MYHTSNLDVCISENINKENRGVIRGVINMTFKLSNTDIESWTATQFWETDPSQNAHAICRICIYVDWEAKTAEIETVMNTNNTPGRIWHGLASWYNLPEDTDFSRFGAFFAEEIQPLLQKIGDCFSSKWDGSNWNGHFSEISNNTKWDLNQLLVGRNVPRHDYRYAFSLEDEFGSDQNLVNYLDLDDIDLLSADLNNEETLTKIITSIEEGDCVFPGMTRADYKAELKEIQARMRE